MRSFAAIWPRRYRRAHACKGGWWGVVRRLRRTLRSNYFETGAFCLLGSEGGEGRGSTTPQPRVLSSIWDSTIIDPKLLLYRLPSEEVRRNLLFRAEYESRGRERGRGGGAENVSCWPHILFLLVEYSQRLLKVLLAIISSTIFFLLMGVVRACVRACVRTCPAFVRTCVSSVLCFL